MTVAMVELYRILGRFEKGPVDDPACRLTPEGAALDAYLCSADKPTLAFGCTYHPDGTPVRMGDSITPQQVYPYTEAAVSRVVADVKRIVKRPLDDYQMAALCSFVFNLGGKNLEDSTRLLPAIEAGRWEDAAEEMNDFIRAWGKLEGRWHRKAERGLLIRRYAEGCLLLGLDWQPWCNTTNIKLYEELRWQPDWVDPKGIRTGGRYFDEVLPTTTEFTTIEAMARATPLPTLIPSELVLTTKAEPVAVPAPGAAGQPEGSPPAQPPAAPATQSKPAPPSSPSASAGPVAAPKAPQAPTPLPVPSSKPVDTKPPEQLPPPLPPPKDPLPIDLADPKDMILSRRFWGLMVTAIGTTHLIPADWSKWMANETTRELVSWILVCGAGALIYWWGKRKAKRPLK